MMSKWIVMVTISGMNQCIGYYDTAQEANIAYSRAIQICIVLDSVENSGREHKHNAQADDLTNVPTMAKMCARSLLLLPPPPESIGYSLGVATDTGAFHLYSYVSVIARSNHVGAGEKDGD